MYMYVDVILHRHIYEFYIFFHPRIFSNLLERSNSDRILKREIARRQQRRAGGKDSTHTKKKGNRHSRRKDKSRQ